MADELNTGVAGAESTPTGEPQAPDAGVAAPQPSSPGEGEGVAGTGEGQQEDKTVPVHVLVAERREWQKKLEKFESMEAELAQMRNVMMSQMAPPKPPQPEYDPDHFMTYADFEALQKKQDTQRQTMEFEAKYSANLVAARNKYPDFDNVIANLKSEMQKHPELGGIEQFDYHPNGPFWAYRLGKQIEAEKKTTPNRALDVINQNLNRPATLSNASGGTNPAMDEYQRIMALPEAEFQKEWEKRKGFQ